MSYFTVEWDVKSDNLRRQMGLKLGRPFGLRSARIAGLEKRITWLSH